MPFGLDISNALEGLADVKVGVAHRIKTGAQAVAQEMEAVAKRDAPWTDRTGNARRTMTGFTAFSPDGQLLVGVAGHMSYSPDLELRHFRRYAILRPTVNAYLPTIMTRVVVAALKDGG